MDVLINKQDYADTEEMLISYPKNQKHIYDMRDGRECAMNIVNIDGCEYETDGEVCLSRREKSEGYKVSLHFSKEQNDISSTVQKILIEEFIKGLK